MCSGQKLLTGCRRLASTCCFPHRRSSNPRCSLLSLGLSLALPPLFLEERAELPSPRPVLPFEDNVECVNVCAETCCQWQLGLQEVAGEEGRREAARRLRVTTAGGGRGGSGGEKDAEPARPPARSPRAARPHSRRGERASCQGPESGDQADVSPPPPPPGLDLPQPEPPPPPPTFLP